MCVWGLHKNAESTRISISHQKLLSAQLRCAAATTAAAAAAAAAMPARLRNFLGLITLHKVIR